MIPAYDYPQYHVMDMGEGFDAVCEDGKFDLYANSYLVFWSADEEKLRRQSERIYIKYNKTRKEEFQIKTCICRKEEAELSENREMADPKEENAWYVEKAALSLKGMGHIWSFEEKYRRLSKQHRSLKMAEPTYCKEKNAVYFPYLTGRTWAERLGEDLSGGKLLFETLHGAMEQIYDITPESRKKFLQTEEFLEVFGENLTAEELALLAGDTACEVSNIDAL